MKPIYAKQCCTSRQSLTKRPLGRMQTVMQFMIIVSGLMTFASLTASAQSTVRVSVNNEGVHGNGDSTFPAIAATSLDVVFESVASDLGVGDTNGLQDVCVYSRNAEELVRASVASGGSQQTTGTCEEPAISSDGRFIAFKSTSSDLVGGDANGRPDIFVHDREGVTTGESGVACGPILHL